MALMQGWHANSWSVPYFWMDKEVVVHIHNGILLSHIKEHIWVSCDDVDEPRTYYTEWNVSERERWISYSDSYIQNIEKWYWRIYLQGSSGETDIENRLMDLGIGKEMGRNFKSKGCMYTYGWFILRFDRKQQNSVKQLSFNKKKKC